MEKSVRTSQADPKNETHYILCIHGTFNAPPKTGPKLWYYKDLNPQNFCFILSGYLRDTFVGAESIWRPIPEAPGVTLPKDVPYPFYWDGGNTHETRIDSGKKLGKLIDTIAKSDPTARIHLIAHSHGGNVTLQGISKYLNILRKDSGKSYSQDITDEFWRLNKASYDAIAEYQKPKNASWAVSLLGPLAAVRRPWAGETELGAFWWGYWECTDRLLGLPKYRQQKYLRKKWATCPSTNALGNIVFMGTPFYSKYWEKHAFSSTVIGILITTTLMFLSISAIAIVIEFFLSPDFTMATVLGIPASFWWIAAIGCLTFVIMASLTEKRYKEGNLYHDETRAWSPAMKALVLNAGKLDEAALALSTEPIVRAYLIPQIKGMLTPDPWKSLQPFPARGIRKTIMNGYHNFWLVVWNILFSAFFVVLYILNFVLVPALSNALLRLFVNLGFGLQKGELDNARVFVEENLRLPHETHNIVHWNVQKILTAASLVDLPELAELGANTDELSSAQAAIKEYDHVDHTNLVMERWKFLWDDEELEKRAKESITMKRLFGQIDQMPHHPRASRDAFVREIKLICVTLEERYKDMAGNVELSHGSYLKNKVVIQSIAFFLQHGKLPLWINAMVKDTEKVSKIHEEV